MRGFSFPFYATLTSRSLLSMRGRPGVRSSSAPPKIVQMKNPADAGFFVSILRDAHVAFVIVHAGKAGSSILLRSTKNCANEKPRRCGVFRFHSTRRSRRVRYCPCGEGREFDPPPLHQKLCK